MSILIGNVVYEMPHYHYARGVREAIYFLSLGFSPLIGENVSPLVGLGKR